MTEVENYNTRKMFASNRIGRLHKPRAIVAASASIPSKYRTIVIKNDENKGFNSGTKRFDCQNVNECPGPAKYSTSNCPSSENVSFSKKGLGGFASKAKRFPTKWNPDCSAAPWEYNTNVKVSHDFNRASCTGNFHKPICNKVEGKNTCTPAPNAYKVTGVVIGNFKPTKKDVVHPPFMSRTKREYMTPKLTNPAPNAYDICQTEDLRAVQSPFKSTTKRIEFTTNTSNPGPATYSPYEQFKRVKGIGLPRKHKLLRLAAPAMQMPPAEPPPGPGRYDVVDYERPLKEYISSSVFRSATNRWGPIQKPNTNPGPATYNPKQIPTSFIYNGDNKWL